jgi:hypothetical protein
MLHVGKIERIKRLAKLEQIAKPIELKFDCGECERGGTRI